MSCSNKKSLILIAYFLTNLIFFHQSLNRYTYLVGLLSLVGLPRFDPPPVLDEFKLMVEQDMGDKPNFRSMGEDPLEDPIDMANPESSDLRDKGLVTSLQVSI